MERLVERERLKPLYELGIGAADGAEAGKPERTLDCGSRYPGAGDANQPNTIFNEDGGRRDGITNGIDHPPQQRHGHAFAIAAGANAVIHALDKITGANVHLGPHGDLDGQHEGDAHTVGQRPCGEVERDKQSAPCPQRVFAPRNHASDRPALNALRGGCEPVNHFKILVGPVAGLERAHCGQGHTGLPRKLCDSHLVGSFRNVTENGG